MSNRYGGKERCACRLGWRGSTSSGSVNEAVRRTSSRQDGAPYIVSAEKAAMRISSWWAKQPCAMRTRDTG